MTMELPTGYHLVYAPEYWVTRYPNCVILVRNDADPDWYIWAVDAPQAHYRAWLHERAVVRSKPLTGRQWEAMQRVIAGTDPALAARCASGEAEPLLCAYYAAWVMEQRYAPTAQPAPRKLLAD